MLFLHTKLIFFNGLIFFLSGPITLYKIKKKKAGYTKAQAYQLFVGPNRNCSKINVPHVYWVWLNLSNRRHVHCKIDPMYY